MEYYEGVDILSLGGGRYLAYGCQKGKELIEILCSKKFRMGLCC